MASVQRLRTPRRADPTDTPALVDRPDLADRYSASASSMGLRHRPHAALSLAAGERGGSSCVASRSVAASGSALPAIVGPGCSPAFREGPKRLLQRAPPRTMNPARNPNLALIESASDRGLTLRPMITATIMPITAAAPTVTTSHRMSGSPGDGGASSGTESSRSTDGSPVDAMAARPSRARSDESLSLAVVRGRSRGWREPRAVPLDHRAGPSALVRRLRVVLNESGGSRP